MVFLIVGVQGMSYAQTVPILSVDDPLRVDPSPVAPGGSLTLTATVRNTGAAQPANAINSVKFHQSDDNAIDANDPVVGSVTVSTLGVNSESTVSISMPAPPAIGTYYYGGSIGTNDTVADYSLAVRLEVTNVRPNLTVALRPYNVYNPISGLYNPVAPGGRFTLEAIVANVGSLTSNATTLTCEYSTNTVNWIDTGTTVTIPAHPPNQSLQSPLSSQVYQINLIAPSNLNTQFTTGTTGIYYYRVRVVPVANESDTTDNDSRSVSIITSSGDLVVDTPTVDKSTLAPGESFTLTAIVRNNSIGNSSAATLQYYRSTDSTLDTTTDTEVGTADTIDPLSGYNTFNQVSANTSTQTVDLTAPTTPGTYYYYACVSTNFYEIRSDNNCSTAVAITVSAPPDLVAELFELRPDTLAPGERFRLDATVTNAGVGQSATTTLRFYESIDRRFRSEEEIGRVSVAAIASNRSSTESIRLTAPSEPGTYYYRAHVDEVANETATTNNWSGYIVLYVEAPLVIESVQPSKSTLAPRERFTLTATVRNDGSTTSARTAMTFYSSGDDSITSRDTSIGSNFVSPITARGTGQVSRTLTAPTRTGTYYYGVCVGDAVGSDVCVVVEISVEEVSIANIQRPPMYWVEADGGTLHSLTGSEVDPFVASVRNATAIAVDMAGGKVYWAEQIANNRSRVRRANLNGGNVQLVKEMGGAVRGLAIDSLKGNLYMTNARPNARGNIQRSKLDGSVYHWNYIDNLNPSLSSPRDIALDVAGGKVYWTEDITDRTGKEIIRIRRANLNGRNVEVVREVSGVPRGLAVDASKGNLYLANTRGVRGNIQRLKLDGSLFHWNYIHIDKADSPQGVALDIAGGKVYWSEAGGIRRANLNGSNRQDVATGIGSPAGIALRVAPVTAVAAAPGAVAAASDATALHANYPNPFNPETWIPYQLQQGADVEISIHSQSGVLVRELSLGYQGAGRYMSRSRAAYWDGRNQLGEPVASGLYFYTLTAGDFSATRRMLILK